MNIFIHQNNETVGPFDEEAVQEMLDSGQILLLTFARLEGETGWRPLSEIMTMREKAPPPPAIPAVEPRRAPPLIENHETSNGAGAGDSSQRAEIQEAASGNLKIECAKCGQHILVDPSYAGMTGVCPACGDPVTIPAAPLRTRAVSARHADDDESAFHGPGHGFAYRLTGLRRLEGFKLPLLFADVFKNRSRPEYDSYFNCGSPATTPDPARLGPDLPRPWFYMRTLIFGVLLVLALCFGYEKFPDPKLLAGIMILGALLVPLSCVMLFFELNTPRNISAYQVAKLLAGGAILSLPVALFISRQASSGFFGTIFTGLALEIAQALIAVALLRAASQYRWILNGLLIGAAAAAGYAALETASYMIYAFFEDMQRGDGKLTDYYATLRAYAFFLPLCHVLWTAILTGALWRVKEDGPFRVSLLLRPRFLRILILVAVLQALWSSGALWKSIGKFSLVRVEQGLWVLSIIGTCWLALLLVQEGLRQVREYAAADDA